MKIDDIVNMQKKYFNTGETKRIPFRLYALKKLKSEIELRKDAIFAALHKDLGKVEFEAYMAEVSLVLGEISFAQKRLKGWARKKRVATPLMHFPSQSYLLSEPLGNVLIMSPWNYPFLLSLMPLVGAIAAGNCVVLKPSNYSSATSEIIKEIIDAGFSEKYIAVVTGGRSENTQLLEQKFDYIFFTGGETVGRLVMQQAAKNLTPFTLELGGKSPCIVDEHANIPLAAKRIIFGKILNAGQTCIAPDYLLVHTSKQEELLEEMVNAVREFLGDEPLSNGDLPKIINKKHFERLLGLLQNQEVLFGGQADEQTMKIAPAILRNVSADSPIMQEEIFGPILPVLAYDNLKDAIDFVNSREKPLAFYAFSDDRGVQNKLLESCSFGGGCINDTIVHIASSRLPFGGVGASGMGSYHGKYSFDTFSHRKAVLSKSTLIDIPVRYHPYTKQKESILKMLLK